MGEEKPQLYRDQKVLAFQVPEDAIISIPVVTSSGGRVNTAALSDGFYNSPAVSLPAARQEGGISWVQFDYGKPVTVRGLVLSPQTGGPVLFKLESGSDGVNWSDTGAKILSGSVVRTSSVDNVNARYFRFVSVKQPPAPPRGWSRWGGATPPPPETINISELTLLGTRPCIPLKQKQHSGEKEEITDIFSYQADRQERNQLSKLPKCLT
jgi:hypothetical protein